MQASVQWRWLYDPQQAQLQVQLADGGVHLSPYKSSRLINLGPLNSGFTVSDAEFFQLFTEALDLAGYAGDQDALRAVGLNALILHHFGRPQMPQSWYFQQQQQGLPYPLNPGSVVALNSGLACADFVVLNHDEQFAECMLLAPQMALSDIKILRQHDAIKVLHNRLQAIRAAQAAAYLKLA